MAEVKQESGATVTSVACPGCGKTVPVHCGDVTGMSLDDITAQATENARRECEAHGMVWAGKLGNSFGFTCDGPAWKGVPVVNGHVVPASAIDVHIDPKGLPEVTLRFPAADAARLGFSTAVIGVDGETREALISLGWTPPAGTAACACGAAHPDGYACTQAEPEPCP